MNNMIQLLQIMHWADKNGSLSMIMPLETLSPEEKRDWLLHGFEASCQSMSGYIVQ